MNGEATTLLDVGEYSFPFKFSLPRNLPSSFECENARIRYSLNGTIEMPTGHNFHVTRAFTVVRPFDLKTLSRLKDPAEAIDSKTVSCLGPCSRGSITGELHVKKSKY